MVEFDSRDLLVVERLRVRQSDSRAMYDLRLQAENIALVQGFEELLCLPGLRNLERLDYQQRTALHVLRKLRGRAILADEVGLGKTIEACMILKEYMLRGLVKRTLILCSPSLVPQWTGELKEKFDLEFANSLDPAFREQGTSAWANHDRIVASLSLARLPAHRQAIIASGGFDLVVVDESHVLRKRTSSAWKLIQELPQKFLLLLTATPVQNDLEELYNLVTLLRPGQLGTPTQFRRQFVDPKDRRKPQRVSDLRELMLDVMVRNTRASVHVNLPPRRARTLRVEPEAEERKLGEAIQALIHREWGAGRISRKALSTLQLEQGSSPAALASTLLKLELPELARTARELKLGAKASTVLEVVKAIQEPVLIFSRFRASLDALADLLASAHVPVFLFHGGLTPQQREQQLQRFTQSRDGVLLLSEVGSEGKNLQFCRHLINFDLPWNPLRIEQRVGRIHRLGQTRPIEILNLCLAGSIEEHLLRILDEKLNMFELVVGELEMILGPLEEEGDFEELVAELSAGSPNRQALEQAMLELERQLLGLKAEADTTQRYDEELFGKQFELAEQ